MLNPASHIDHTLLAPLATPDEIVACCEEAVEHGFASVCVPPVFVALAAARLYGSEVATGTVIGFPLGYDTPQVKLQAAREAVERGARELDLVIQQGLLRAGDEDAVAEEIAQVAALDPDVTVKVIIECCHLEERCQLQLVELIVRTGADYVKTSTGFAASGARIEDVCRLYRAAAGRIKVKAAGGIRDLDGCLDFLAAGAQRIGTSSGQQIMRQWWQREQEGQ